MDKKVPIRNKCGAGTLVGDIKYYEYINLPNERCQQCLYFEEYKYSTECENWHLGLLMLGVFLHDIRMEGISF